MPEAFERCVREVSAKKGTRNAYAVCTAANAGGIKQVRKQEAAARRPKRSGRNGTGHPHDPR